MEILLKSNEVYMQDIICSTIMENQDKTDIDIYNIVCELIDIDSETQLERVFDLIHLNKQTLVSLVH